MQRRIVGRNGGLEVGFGELQRDAAHGGVPTGSKDGDGSGVFGAAIHHGSIGKAGRANNAEVLQQQPKSGGPRQVSSAIGPRQETRVGTCAKPRLIFFAIV